MDIVAESLSANTLKAQNVTVRGQDVLEWFESKLSASDGGNCLQNIPYKLATITPNDTRQYVLVDRAINWLEVPQGASECVIVLPLPERKPGTMPPVMDLALLYRGNGVRPTFTPNLTFITNANTPLADWADYFDAYMCLLTFTTCALDQDGQELIYATIQEATI